ncbi:FixH family protein [Carboxylicivirga sediminis]|uniref:FixH family protein n=1 Tax=Carboxylicivirga sediminis TaxID=2006564 RepID=A0A941F4D5_9BACT|nr:FixH family protein [Carboxylicivirga sediminis]MBR8535480.1 FixH family protein [Carboxylicivirga sediminis]
MKFNWGHGIFLVIVLAVAGFLSMVFITTRERIDMVTEDYYPKELRYDDQIEKIKNYNALSKKVEVTLGDALYIQFPDNIANAPDINGLVHLYRPSDKDLDIEKGIQLDSSYAMSIPLSDLMSGKYELIIEWQANGQPYLTKEVVYVN